MNPDVRTNSLALTNCIVIYILLLLIVLLAIVGIIIKNALESIFKLDCDFTTENEFFSEIISELESCGGSSTRTPDKAMKNDNDRGYLKKVS